VLRVASGVRGVLDLHAFKEEDVSAEPVMATGIFFIAIKTKAQTAPFRHLVRGEAPLVALAATLLAGHRRGKERQRLLGRRERWPVRGNGKEAARGRPRGRLHRAVDLHQLHLVRQAHGGRERLRVVDANGVAERQQESTSEELDALGLIKTTHARQEGLEAIGVLHGPCTPALGELEQRGRAEGRPKPPPRWRTLVLLELNVPKLHDGL
jgi:hypothetical protein